MTFVGGAASFVAAAVVSWAAGFRWAARAGVTSDSDVDTTTRMDAIRRSGRRAGRVRRIKFNLSACLLRPAAEGVNSRSIEQCRQLHADTAEAFTQVLLPPAQPDAQVALDADVDAGNNQCALVHADAVG